jgi:hypothetical protein
MKIRAVSKMSNMQTRRGKNQGVVSPTPVLGNNSFNITNMNNHDGTKYYAKYHDIYIMFQD